MKRLHPYELRRVVEDLLGAAGMSERHSAATADGLIRADLRGVETHGVSNMLRLYLQWLGDGSANPDPKLRRVHDLGAFFSIDSDRAIGLAILPDIMDEVVERAKTYGVAACAVSNGRHAGMMSHHALLAAEAGAIGLAFTATSPRVMPTFGREARLGTNPIAIAAPLASGGFLSFDAATSMVAGNRITTALRTGAKLPYASVVDAEGHINPDPCDATRDVLRRLAPLGGLPQPDGASHKGYGLAVFVELLCGTLLDDGGLPARPPGGATHFLCAIKPGEAQGEPSLAQNVSRLADYLAGTPPEVGRERVFYPGQMEEETEKQRRAEGIPLHDEVYAWMESACAEHGVSLPSPLERVER